MFEIAWEAPARDLWVGGGALVLVGWLAWRFGPRSRLLWGLRAAALLLLFISLAKPSLVRYDTSYAKPAVAVWLDSSAWMGVKEEGRARFDLARGWLKSARKALEAKAEVSYYRVGDASQKAAFEGLSASPSGGLRIDKALRDSASRGSAPAQVWLLSDGVGDLSEDLDGALAGFGGKVNVVGVGRAHQPKGVTLRAVNSPDFVFLHDPFPVRLDWEASGLQGRSVRFKLLQGTQVIGEETRRVAEGFEALSSTLTAQASALGSQTYHLEVQPLGEGAGPAIKEDFRVEVIRQKLRILFLCGRPSYEYSALREFIKADPANELVSFVILRNQENISPVPEQELSLIPFPAQEIFVQSLFGFDLFIFQDFAFWRFGLPPAYLESMRQFVERGGGLLVIGGENSFGGGQYKSTPIEELLPSALPPGGAPYIPGLFKPQPADLHHPLLQIEGAPDWAALPPLDGFQKFGANKKETTALAASKSGEAVFATRNYGKGRVFLSGTNSTWRWKLGAGYDWRVGSFYERFWGRAFQYLTGGLDLKRVKFAPLPARLARPVAVLHVFDEDFRPLSGPAVKVEIMEKAGAKLEPLPFREVRPGVFEVEAGAGSHRLQAVVHYQGKLWGQDEVELSWAPPGMKFEPLDEGLLKKIAQKSGGRYARLDSADPRAWINALPEPVPVKTLRSRKTLWASPHWLWAISALLILEWYLRRRRGYR